MYNMQVCDLILDHNTLKGYSSLGSGTLNPEVIRKPQPRLILAFIKAVGFGYGSPLPPLREKGHGITGTMGLLLKGLRALGS